MSAGSPSPSRRTTSRPSTDETSPTRCTWSGVEREWYVGAMTDWAQRELEVDFSFLPAGAFRMEAYEDGANADRFGSDQVFKDVDSIPLGIDFRQHLEGALSQCRLLLAIVGDQWMGSEIAEGKRRIDDPRDHLRLELEVALSRNIPVIPVLVRKASIPGEDALPPSLRSIAYRNGIQVRPDPDFHGDMDRLIKGIEPHLMR